MEQFTYIIKYKKGKTNVVSDAFSRLLISTLQTKLIRFDHIRDLYALYVDFSSLYHNCEILSRDSYYRHGAYLREIDYAFLNVH